MFDIRCFDMSKLAAKVQSHIDVFYVTPSNVVVGVTTGHTMPYRVNEVDKLDTISQPYDNIIFINIQPDKICVFSDMYSSDMKEIAEFLERELCIFRTKSYSQDKACNVVKATVENFSARTLTELAEALTKKPNLDMRDGYYGTLGERAFFRLVELGRVNIDDAFEDVFDVKED